MFKIKVTDTYVENVKGTSKKTGKDFNFNQQMNVFIEINGEVRKIPQIVKEGKQPYAPGNYLLDIEKYCQVNNFNNLVVDPFARMELIPVPATGSMPLSKVG